MLLHQSGVFLRLIALFVDFTIGLLCCIPLVIYVTDHFLKNLQNGRIVIPIYDYKFSLLVVGVLFSICFVSAIFERLFCGTLGKRLIGIKVVNGFKLEVDFFRALGRQFIKFGFLFLIAVFPFVSIATFIRILMYVIAPGLILNLLVAVFTPEKQAAHDLAIRSYVIREPDSKIFVPILIFVISIFVSGRTISWLDQHVVSEALREVPPSVKQSLVQDFIQGHKIPFINIEDRQGITMPFPASTENYIFEVASDTIYQDVLKQDIQKIATSALGDGQNLSSRGPVYTIIHRLGSNEYEFKTYIPPVANLLANPNAYSFSITSATGKSGSSLTAESNGPIEIQEKMDGTQRYIVVSKKVFFWPNEEIENIRGEVSLRLPTNVLSEIIRPNSSQKEIKFDAQSFQITSMTDRTIEFTHYGPFEFFLGLIAYDKKTQHPIRGGVSIVKNVPTQTSYSYAFNRPIEKYEFNTALLYYLETFPFSTPAPKE